MCHPPCESISFSGRRVFLFILALLFAYASVNAVAGDRKQAGKSTPAGLYHNYCSVCHGDAGDGKSRARGSLIPPPADFTDPKLKDRFSVAYMAAITREGKPGTAMTGWKTQLNATEIDAVARYVRNTFVDNPGGVAVRKGRTLYGHFCVDCHGIDGRGVQAARTTADAAGAAGVAGVKAPDLTTKEKTRELTRDRMIAAIAVGKVGTTMKGFSGQLSPEDIDAVAEYMRTQVLHGGLESVSGTSAHGKK